MRVRWIIRGGLLLLGGAAANVGVAWWSAAFAEIPTRMAWNQWRRAISKPADGSEVVATLEEFQGRTWDRLAVCSFWVSEPNRSVNRLFLDMHADRVRSERLDLEKIEHAPGVIAPFLAWVNSGPNPMTLENSADGESIFREPDPMPTPLFGTGRTGRPNRGTPLDDRNGWPMRSMFCSAYVARGYPAIAVSGIPLANRRLSQPDSVQIPVLEFRALPLGVLPIGFAVDSMAFTAVAWGVVATSRFGVRRLRQRRGHCAACGYDLRGQATAGCPECGAGRVVSDAGPWVL